MSTVEPRLITVIGAGTIGLGWITLFLAAGHHVRVNSTRANAADVVREGLELFAPGLPGDPVDPAKLAERLSFEPDLERAVSDVYAVQENTPENLTLKQELFERIGIAAKPGTLLLSSTSTLLPDDLGARMADSSRVIVGHPFNPPHVVPLVEVVGGSATDPNAIQEAVAFYRQLGKVPIVLRRPIAAFAANRLQSALLRESIHLVREGVVTVAELDEVVTASIGLRWATMGPFLSFHLGGGQGGLRKWLTTLGSGLERGWEGLGKPSLDETTLERLLAQAEEAYGGHSYEEYAARRDKLQKAVLEAVEGIPPLDAPSESPRRHDTG
ncbi:MULTISPECIES: 3-hydroxyacyl-CoA dehydrogenase NAD-binding domain-containing protein [Saccharothrix]|uniref:3-hydroxyacyl-CoA dehydrogenase NAD-binding domain-containing protein n=1 Tax=Saccharothrix TaxID=2071 RepID=UPI00093EF716|nr:3-hydroxyacyl-CoA dehydrogenase NAD-binding domain-containing protein [Saccharothrix sp. CB00851]OKI29942.1 hydroxylacyl-CoA dehydrogenase [Saccharothrix sp. CB00851]